MGQELKADDQLEVPAVAEVSSSKKVFLNIFP
jgi:hypothetical protein